MTGAPIEAQPASATKTALVKRDVHQRPPPSLRVGIARLLTGPLREDVGGAQLDVGEGLEGERSDSCDAMHGAIPVGV